MSNFQKAVDNLDQALYLDEHKRHREAYFQYIKCVKVIAESLMILSIEQNKENTEKLISYSMQCMNRVKYIHSNHFNQISHTKQQVNKKKEIRRTHSVIPSVFHQSPKINSIDNKPLSLNKSLYSFRKQWEQQELEKLNKKMQLQQQIQKMQNIKIRKDEDVENFKKQVKKKRFKWKKNDEWGKFIDTHFNYFTMPNELIGLDKKVIDSVNDKNLKDKTVLEKLQKHMDTILNSGNHSLIKLLKEFIEKISKEYDMDLDVEGLQQDITTFMDQLLSCLLRKYWNITVEKRDQACEDILIGSIQKKIYQMGIYSLVISHYARNSEILKNQSIFDNKVNEFNSNNIDMKHCGIRRQFRLSDDENAYKEVIENFQLISTKFTVEEKLEVVQKCLTTISESVPKYWENKKEEQLYYGFSKDDFICGAEDLVPIFIYVILKSRVKSLVVQFKYFEEFLPETEFRGMGGYSLATLETVINQIKVIEWNELVSDKKKLVEKEKKKEEKRKKKKYEEELKKLNSKFDIDLEKTEEEDQSTNQTHNDNNNNNFDIAKELAKSSSLDKVVDINKQNLNILHQTPVTEISMNKFVEDLDDECNMEFNDLDDFI